MVHELTGENRADGAEEVGSLGLERVEARRHVSRERRAAQLLEHCCIMWLCPNPSCVFCVFCSELLQCTGRGCLNGHPSAPKVMSSDVTMRSFPILFKKNGPGLTKNATWPKTRTSLLSPVSVQSGRECSFCSARGRSRLRTVTTGHY